jgi:hypothetical protein
MAQFDKSRVAYPLHYAGCSLTQGEIDDIVRFIHGLEGIDHRVLTIMVKSTADVTVETGRGPDSILRDSIHLRKGHGAWTVIRQESGRVIINQ